jgi:superoxide dismutase, Fe-Mn family
MPAIILPDLPYKTDALAPVLSQETLEYHWGKHHRAYVDNLNKLLPPDNLQNLESLVQTAPPGPIFNNAGQIWNHNFYWQCLAAKGSAENICDLGPLHQAINTQFGSLDTFKAQFIEAAVKQFGSGWAWLVKDKITSRLTIETTANAETPLQKKDKIPLLTCDVWEHAYYIDYRNRRPDYLKAFWEIVNWAFILKNWKK